MVAEFVRKCDVGLLGAVLEFELVVLVEVLGLVVTLELVVSLAFRSKGVGGTVRLLEALAKRLKYDKRNINGKSKMEHFDKLTVSKQNPSCASLGCSFRQRKWGKFLFCRLFVLQPSSDPPVVAHGSMNLF